MLAGRPGRCPATRLEVMIGGIRSHCLSQVGAVVQNSVTREFSQRQISAHLKNGERLLDGLPIKIEGTGPGLVFRGLEPAGGILAQ